MKRKSTKSVGGEKLLTNAKLMTVFFVQLNEAYQLTVLLPIVVFMCRDFGIPSLWLGVYTSILNASFGFCQFLVSYLWCYMSDIYGRRIILLCGLFGTFISMIVFGFSTTFPMALISRCLTGLFQGNLGVLKAYLADITDSDNRAFAFSILAISFGAGTIMGSALGGILIETNDVDAPDDEYIKTTSILKWFIFEHDYPYLLPTAVCGGFISLNAIIWTSLFLKEEKLTRKVSNYTNGTNGTMDIKSDIEMTSTVSAPRLNLTCTDNTYLYNTNKYDVMYQSLPEYREFDAMMSTFKVDRYPLLKDECIDIYDLETASDLLKYTKLGHALLQYGIAAISYMMFKEMGPVFMAQALTFDSVYIGYTQAWSGVVFMVFCLWIQPILLRKINHRILSQICCVFCAICTVSMPSIYWFTLIRNEKLYFVNAQWWLLLMACLVEWIGTMSVATVFVISVCWVNNSVSSIHLGKANGIGQTLAAFVRGFGPLLTGFIWSESFEQVSSDGIHYAVYYAYLPAAILYLMAVIDSKLYIPSNFQLTWEERENEQNTKTIK